MADIREVEFGKSSDNSEQMSKILDDLKEHAKAGIFLSYDSEGGLTMQTSGLSRAEIVCSLEMAKLSLLGGAV